jgi:hypothetical protein
MAVIPSGRGAGTHSAAEDGVDLVAGVRGALGGRVWHSQAAVRGSCRNPRTDDRLLDVPLDEQA